MRAAFFFCALLLCCNLCACKPGLIILSPREGSIWGSGEEINFICFAPDVTHGFLEGNAIVWRSDRDGVLGTGAWLRTSTLSSGHHTITVEATDPQHWHSSASRTVFVLEATSLAGSTTTTNAPLPPVITTTTTTCITTSTTAPSSVVSSTTTSIPVPSSSIPTTTTTVYLWTLVHLGEDVHITSLWGSSAADVYAGGGDTKTNEAILFHYDGADWIEVLRIPDGGCFYDIWGNSKSDVYAVGGYIEGLMQKGIIYHYNGTAWRELYVTTLGVFYSVCTDSEGSNVFASGATASGPWVLRLENAAWRVRYAGLLPGSFYCLRYRAGTLFAASGIFQMSKDPEEPPALEGKVMRSTDEGLTWSSVYEATGVFLKSIWSDGLVVCVTGGEPVERSQGVAALSEDGGETWRTLDIAASHYFFGAVSGAAENDLYIGADGPDGILFHYDGTAWSRIRSDDFSLPPIWAVLYIDSHTVIAAGDGVIVRFSD